MSYFPVCLSVSPTYTDGPTQGKRVTLSRVGIEPDDPRIRSLLLYRLSYQVRQGLVVGIKDVKSWQMIMNFVP